jgi:hypothetical protein
MKDWTKLLLTLRVRLGLSKLFEDYSEGQLDTYLIEAFVGETRVIATVHFPNETLLPEQLEILSIENIHVLKGLSTSQP